VSDSDYTCTGHKPHDDLIEKLMSGMPDSWNGDDSAEPCCVDYVREIERRLIAAGGSLERRPEENS
jgi:hypothetical protein